MPCRSSNKTTHIPKPTVQGWTALVKYLQPLPESTSIPSYLSSLSRCRPDVSLQLLMNGRIQEVYPYNQPSVPLTPLPEPRVRLYLFAILPLQTPLQSFLSSRQLDDSSKPIHAEILPQMAKIEDSV